MTAEAPAAGMSVAQQRACLRLMLLTRALDERIWTLTQQGKVAITGPCRVSAVTNGSTLRATSRSS